MKKISILLVVSLLVLLGACKEQAGKSPSQSSDAKADVSEMGLNPASDAKGYELMKSKCYICHFERPDPSKRDKMVAPPMLRVQEHYLPNYPDKEEFVQAVMAIVKNPSEENSLMPGAVRKFNLMPKLPYEDDELRLIVEALYNMDFENVSKGAGHESKLTLDNGTKWVVSAQTYKLVQEIDQNLESFSADKIESYNQLGKDVFGKMKFVLMDKSYTGELFDQIHAFFYGIEAKTHTLISEKDLAKAKELVPKLHAEVKIFYDFFQSK